MLITNAEIYDPGAGPGPTSNIRIIDGRIAAIGPLTPLRSEGVLDAGGCALLPGLHDHHIHLLSFAASLESVHCGPPTVGTESELARVLRDDSGVGWLRGYGYHESVAGEIDRRWLDRCLPDRPARIQHRSGRLWMLNSAALGALRAAAMTAHDRGALDIPEDGRFYDQDTALGALLGRSLPPVGPASRSLAGYGVTGLTDMTPGNTTHTLELFRDLRRAGTLVQSLHVAGSPELRYPFSADGVTSAATKIHLHDSALPPFEETRDVIRASHGAMRPVAVHCVTEVELVFALAAFEAAGTLDGDRIEHASVAPPELLVGLNEQGLLVVTQPNFIAERGDAYLDDVTAAELPWLYRARSFLDHAIPLAGGTDAPFGCADPWVAIRAAVQRRTTGGRMLGADEALTPEDALGLFLGSADRPDQPRHVLEGGRADLCLLNAPWSRARETLSSDLVRATLCAGRWSSGTAR